MLGMFLPVPFHMPRAGVLTLCVEYHSDIRGRIPWYTVVYTKYSFYLLVLYRRHVCRNMHDVK